MSQQLELQTICKHCVFAEFKEEQQVGCEAGFLAKYIKTGDAKQSEDGSYIIENRRCLGCRLKDSYWTKKFNNENLLEHMQEEIKFRCDVVVILNTDATQEELEKTTKSILASSIRPTKVVYAYRELNIGYAKLLKYVNATYAGTGVRWQIKEMDSKEASIEDMIADSTKDCVADFVTVWMAGSEIPAEFIEQIRVFLREEMKAFILILPNENGEGLVLLRAALMAAGGNAPIEVTMENGETQNITNFIDKLIVLSREQGKVHYIWNSNFQPLQ